MALTVETGAIVPGADSYVEVVAADAYHLNNNNAAWALAADDATKEAALRKAARYLDGYYRARWKGRRVQPVSQPLEWPRACVEVPYSPSRGGADSYDTGFAGGFSLPSDTIPQRLKDAQCALALRALSGELAADATAGVKREKVDVLETEYFAPGGNAGQTVYTEVEFLISDYLIATGSGDLLRG